MKFERVFDWIDGLKLIDSNIREYSGEGGVQCQNPLFFEKSILV